MPTHRPLGRAEATNPDNSVIDWETFMKNVNYPPSFSVEVMIGTTKFYNQ
jgi:hypothetical protein